MRRTLHVLAFAALAMYAAPVAAQQHRTVTSAVVDFPYPADSQYASVVARLVEQMKATGDRFRGGCFYGSVQRDSIGRTYAQIDSAVVVEGCEQAGEMIGLFAIWPFADRAPVGDPVAVNMLRQLADTFPQAAFLAIPYAFDDSRGLPYPLVRHFYLLKVDRRKGA